MTFFDVADSAVTVAAIAVGPVINIFLIYRLMTRKAVMDNFQKLIIGQCAWALLPALVLLLSFFFDNLQSAPFIILSILYHVWKDTDLLLVTCFSNYWKNIFVKNNFIEAFNYALLFVFLIGMQITGAVAHVTQIRVIANIAVTFQFIGSLIVLVIHIYCFVTVNRMKKGTHSDMVLKGIKKMSKGLLLKGLFVLLIIFQIIMTILIPVFGSYCIANDPCYSFIADHSYLFYGMKYTNNIVTELTVIYPLISVLLTWYCISGLLRKEKKKMSIRGIVVPLASTTGTLVPVRVESLPL